MSGDTDWYCAQGGKSQGPHSIKDLLHLLDSNAIQRTTLVWQRGMSNWEPLEVALSLNDRLPPPIPGLSEGLATAPPHGQEDASHQSKPGSPPDRRPHPWRRFFARVLDTLIFASVVSFALTLIVVALDENAGNSLIEFSGNTDNRYLTAILTTALVIVPCAVLIGLTTSSIGKLIFGVRVSTADGRPIGFPAAFRREVMVWFRGWGMGIPLISLFTLLTAYSNLRKDGQSSWDKDLGVQVTYRPNTPRQWFLSFLGVALWLLVNAWLFALL